MREIKFRIWDCGQMFYKVHLTTDANMAVFDKEWKECTEEAELMQFTGLNDRNGKEIFEGDIIKIHKFGCMAGPMFSEWDKSDLFQVKFGNARFCAESLNIENESYPDLDINGIYEVVGDIYSNPSLLTQ